MARSNLTGGKHHKKGKKKRAIVDTVKEKKMETAANNQVYALVKKKFGGSRLLVSCSDDKERSAIIPGKFFKKIWLNVGDLLLCDLNLGNDDSLCYIIHKYTIKDANKLKSQGKISFDISPEEESNKGFKFTDDQDNNNVDQDSLDDDQLDEDDLQNSSFLNDLDSLDTDDEKEESEKSEDKENEENNKVYPKVFNENDNLSEFQLDENID